MIHYQLPTGKTVHLTVEEYLNLSDEDIQYMMAYDMGETILNPFQGSILNTKGTEKEYDFDFSDEDLPDDLIDDNPFDEIIDLGL